MGHTLQDYFVFKDKLQELIDKNIVELDIDMRAVTINVVFIDEDMVNLMSPQDNEDDNNDEGDWVTFESKRTRKRRLHALKIGSQQTYSPPKRARKRPLLLKEVTKKEKALETEALTPLLHKDDLLE